MDYTSACFDGSISQTQTASIDTVSRYTITEGFDFDFGFDAGSLSRDNGDDLEALEVSDGDN